jgi:RsiW-degrading membrane proteinase PrsW (M82 family)
MRAWPALILAPFFALAAQIVGYALVTPACQHARAWPIHLSFLLFFALCAATALGAWASLRNARQEFLPLAATWSGVFFAAVVLAQWVATFILTPCMHSP